MKNIKTNVLRVLCLVGYGIFIGTALMQSFDAFAESEVLTMVGKCGLGFGATAMLVFLLNKDGKICSLKERLLKKEKCN